MAGEIGEAPAAGLGKILTESRFAVPNHQRDYSWTEDEVGLLLDDVEAALERGDRQYFVGLMVFLGSDGGEVQVLDGQQRLATAVIFYSAVRNWLRQYGQFQQDADQIQGSFIGRHEIGQRDLLPRLVLNSANNQVFLDYIVNPVAVTDIKAAHAALRRNDRNKRMLASAVYCHQRIADIAATRTLDETYRHLVGMAIYLRDAVSVVRLNVSNEETAFTIFETLNDRGLELSPLDLVKNYLFGRATQHSQARMRDMESRWTQMMSLLSNVKSDSFLKAFWTSRHGRAQATKLFGNFKREYATPDAAVALSKDMLAAAEKYAALETSDDPVWAPYSAEARETVRNLKLLGSQQVHPIMLAALDRFAPPEVEKLLRLLEVLIVRYQLVGGGRTGRLEIACARVARAVYMREISDTSGTRKVTSAADVFRELREIYPSDDTFGQDFARKQEESNQKAVYLLRAIERERRRREAGARAAENEPGALTLEHILPVNPGEEWSEIIAADDAVREDCIYRLGNMCLLTRDDNRRLGRAPFERKKADVYSRSTVLTTRKLLDYSVWDRKAIEARQEHMARLAVSIWRFP